MSEDDARTADAFFKKEDPEYDGALALISDTIGRAKALFDPLPILCAPHHEGDPLAAYKIALIPYGLTVKTLAGDYEPGGPHPPENACILQEHQFDHFALCLNNEGQLTDIERWCENIVALCACALKIAARFVVLPELSHPSFWPGRRRSLLGAFDRRRKLVTMRSQFENEIQLLATQHNAVIISGSYHDWETFENISPIFFPSAEDTRNHKKLTAAYGVGEHIKAAHGIDYPVYHFNRHRFCVLICSDAFDLNMFFRQVLAIVSGHTPTSPEIFFVPSFYVSEEQRHAMKEACQQLSLATGQTVVFVNQKGDLAAHSAFVAGVELQPQPIESIYLLELSAALTIENASSTAPMRRALQFLLRSRRTF